jgi:hypothetical protein
MNLHIFFVCVLCGRRITGCFLSCPGEHRIEEVDSCAVCARKGDDDC